jgi:hypothetical protein
MSKFKVGDKVYRLLDRKEANILWEVSSVQVMKSGDKEYHNYVLKGEGDFGDRVIGGVKYKGAFLNFEEELELYKTPHQRLLELGWALIHEDENIITYGKNPFTTIEIYKNLHKHFTIKADFYFDLQLAEVLVDYLKELEK